MGERTEAPTARHLAEMRRKGQVAQSAELTGAATLLLAIYLLGSRMGGIVTSLQDIMRNSFASLGHTDLDASSLLAYGSTVAGRTMAIWMPVVLMLMLAGVVTSLAQTRGLISAYRLRPDFGRVNPASGIKRIFSAQGLFEIGKGLLKMVLLGIILYGGVRDVPARLAVQTQAGLGPAIAYLAQTLSGMAKQAALLLLLAAGIDYLYMWRQHRQRVKMTHEEVTEEFKNAEGQPMIRAKIRQMQRRWSRQRMMQALVHADVVVTNPTHLAIALHYDSRTMAAPVVVAKGKGVIAEQIMKRARELGIPLVQNIPLAHALIHVELDDPVPVTLYRAVAEVLAFVYRLRNRGG